MSPSDSSYVFFNGALIPYDEAKVHVATPGFRFGLSVFEVMPAYWNEAHGQLYVFRLHDHSRRLVHSMKILRMDLRYTAHDLSEAVLEVLRANAFQQDVAIRPIVYIGGEGHMDAAEPVELVILARPPDSPYGPQSGLHLCVSSWGRIADHVMPPRVKSAANYENSRLAALDAHAGGYDGAILLNERGKVSEFQTGCIFIVREGVPVTPPVTGDILESITRDTAIQLLREVHGLETEVREVDRTELYIADEAFVGASLSGIRPVFSVDGVEVGEGEIGSITRVLRQTYYDVHRGTISLHEDWRTPVYV